MRLLQNALAFSCSPPRAISGLLIVSSKDREGRARHCVIERGGICEKGSLVAVAKDNGLKVGRLKSGDFPQRLIWGKEIGYLQCTR